jgi:hypothetical protein
MKKLLITPLLGGMLLSATWASAQQGDPRPARPAADSAGGGGGVAGGGVVVEVSEAERSPDGPKPVITIRPARAGVAASAQGGGGSGSFGGGGSGGGSGGGGFGGGGGGIGRLGGGGGSSGSGTIWFSSANATMAGKAEKAAFLGVVTTRVTGTLRSQLKLKAGLAVESVEPKSSAEAAGLQAHDIIEKCDDQWLINPAQFVGLLRMYTPGDSVTLTVLREGDRKKITAKLEERETYAVDDEGDILYAKSLALNNPLAITTTVTPPGKGKVIPPVQRIITGTLGTAPLASGFVATFGDDKQQLMITMRDGHQILTVMDSSGKQVFQGPIDTPEQRNAVPANVRKKLEEMDQIKIKIRPLNGGQSEAGPEPETKPAP